MSEIAEYTEAIDSRIRSAKVSAKPDVRYESLPSAHVPQRKVGSGYMLQIAKVTSCLLVADIVAVLVAYLTSLLIATNLLGHLVNHFYPFAACVVTAHILSIWVIDLYPALGWHPAQELKQLVRAAAVTAAVLLVAVLAVHQNNSPYVFMAILSFPLLCMLLPLARSISRRVMRRFDIHIPFYFVGSRDLVLRAYGGMTRFGWNVLKPVGRFVHEDENFEPALTLDYDDEYESVDFQLQFERQATYKGTTDDVIPMASAENVYWLFVVGAPREYERSEVRTDLYRAFPQVVSLHSPQLVGGSGSQLLTYGLASGIRTEESLLLMWPQLVKRAMDIILAASALIFLMPLLLLIGLAVKFTSRGPILFSQERLGYGGKPFSFDGQQCS